MPTCDAISAAGVLFSDSEQAEMKIDELRKKQTDSSDDGGNLGIIRALHELKVADSAPDPEDDDSDAVGIHSFS